MISRRLTALSLICAVGASLLACDAIVGVSDVSLKQDDTTQIDATPDPTNTFDATTSDTSIPTGMDSGPPPPPAPLIVAGGISHTCAKSSAGAVKCWGENALGQVGNGVNAPDGGTTPNVFVPAPVVGLGAGIVDIGAGLNHTCATQTNGNIVCWGYNGSGQLGVTTAKIPQSSIPVAVPGVTGVAFLGVGSYATCVVLTSGSVMCWGDNTSGELGTGTKTDFADAGGEFGPVMVQNLTDAVQVGVGGSFACALRKNGSVVCWGQNGQGQLGNGGTGEALTPSGVQLAATVTQIAVGYDFACALETTGYVSCWGANDYGQLGNGTSTSTATSTPVVVTRITDAQRLAAGIWHICAQRTGGTIECWGDNDDGELGTGLVPDAGGANGTPVDVKGITSVARVGPVEGFHSCAAMQSGAISCWGSNSTGQLGEDSEVRQAYAPVNVVGYP